MHGTANPVRRLFKRLLPVRIVPAVAAALALAGVALAGNGLAIQAKAALAQLLLERAFAKSLVTNAPVKAWPWADTWPVARLGVPRLGEQAVVLKGGSGEALAFGPGHLEGTPQPGEPGAAVVSAHRDTHFRFLGRLRTGDEIRVIRKDKAEFSFRVTSMNVVSWDKSGIDPQRDGHWLVLTTCWPLDAATPGELRFVVRARLSGAVAERRE